MKDASTQKGFKTVVVYDNLASFVENDLEIIGKISQVRKFRYTGKMDLLSLGSSIARSKLVYCWFALGYATSSVLLSKILRRKSVVVAGGWDVIYLPEIEYGAMANNKRIRRTKYALRKADKVIAVSESTKKEVLRWVERDVDVVYNAIDTKKFRPDGEKEDLVVTVGAIDNLTRYKKKGMETFLKVASRMPELDFVIIGHNSPEWDKKLRELASANTTVTGRITDSELLSYYQRAKVYVQISYHESFGVSMAEAMSCGNVPVVTRRSALPEVVGNTGFYAEYGNVDETIEAIRKALNSGEGDRCRERIQERFDLSIRERRLLNLLNDVLSS